MPQGLEVYNASGVKILSVTDRLTKYVGYIDITQANASGSISVQLPQGNLMFASFIPSDFAFPTPAYGSYPSFPSISVSGNVLSWSYGARPSWILQTAPVYGRLIYGGY